MQAVDDAIVEMTKVAVAPAPLTQRADDLLERLNRSVPFDSAWMAHVDGAAGSYGTLSTRNLDESIRDYLAGPINASDIAATGIDRPRPPISPSDLPYPVHELQT